MTVGLGLSVEGVRMGSGRRGRRVGDGSCRSPPTPAVAVEEIDVVDDLALQQPVELLRVDAVGSLDLAVQPQCAGLDADLSDALVQQMPVTGLAELLAAVGLNLVNRARRGRHRADGGATGPAHGYLIVGTVAQARGAGATITVAGTGGATLAISVRHSGVQTNRGSFVRRRTDLDQVAQLVGEPEAPTAHLGAGGP